MYKHRQVGWIILVISIPLILILGFWAALTPVPYVAITAIALLVCIILFSTLTVVGDARELSFYFGPGIVRRRFVYKEIKSAEKVRNRWYYGWGVRWYGPGWLYNVAGLDAIELTLASGKRLRIGTDEPDKLLNFVRSKIQEEGVS